MIVYFRVEDAMMHAQFVRFNMIRLKISDIQGRQTYN